MDRNKKKPKKFPSIIFRWIKERVNTNEQIV